MVWKLLVFWEILKGMPVIKKTEPQQKWTFWLNTPPSTWWNLLMLSHCSPTMKHCKKHTKEAAQKKSHARRKKGASLVYAPSQFVRVWGQGSNILACLKTRSSDFPVKNRRCLDVFLRGIRGGHRNSETHPISAKVCLSRVSSFWVKKLTKAD